MDFGAHEAFAEANVLKEHAAARYLGVSVSTLRRRRAARRRPLFVQIDRSIGYRRTELDSFLDDNTIGPEVDQGDSPDVDQGRPKHRASKKGGVQ